MTKAFTFAFACVALMLAITAGPAAAQAAWCLDEPGAGVMNCGFQTFAQCQASRPGGSTFCFQNPAVSSGRERRK
jgi:uncharacterized protein DUF3551